MFDEHSAVIAGKYIGYETNIINGVCYLDPTKKQKSENRISQYIKLDYNIVKYFKVISTSIWTDMFKDQNTIYTVMLVYNDGNTSTIKCFQSFYDTLFKTCLSFEQINGLSENEIRTIRENFIKSVIQLENKTTQNLSEYRPDSNIFKNNNNNNSNAGVFGFILLIITIVFIFLIIFM